MKRAPVIAIFIAIVAILWIGSGFVGGGKVPAEVSETSQAAQPETVSIPRVRVVTSKAAPRIREIKLYGRTEPERTVEVSSETTGKIVSMDLIEGSMVDKGDVIVHLSMDGRKAKLDDAKAQVKFHEISYDAAEELSKKQFKSPVKLAEEFASLEAVRAALSIAKLDITRTRIKAPFEGTLEKLLLDVGDYVHVGDAVAHIVDLDPIVVAVEVTEREISQVEMGQRVKVLLLSGENREGNVSYISRSGNSETRTFRVEVKLENADYSIAEGMTADVTLLTNPVSAHYISPAILTLDDKGILGVKSVDADQLVAFHPVQIVVDTPNGIWISGLPESAQLISVGQEFVKEGQLVEAIRVE